MKAICSRTLIALAAIMLMVSCSKDDEPNNPIDNDNPIQNQDPIPSANIESIVKDNTSVNATYSDYMFTFTITSTIKEKLPSDAVKFGIEHLASFYQETVDVSVENQAYYYSKTTNGNKEIITFKNPFWFYYVATSEDKDKWAKSEMYYASYMALKNKGYSNLSSDEKSLYDKLIKYLNEYQSEAKRYYRPTICVLINNRFYNIKTYQIP